MNYEIELRRVTDTVATMLTTVPRKQWTLWHTELGRFIANPSDEAERADADFRQSNGGII